MYYLKKILAFCFLVVLGGIFATTASAAVDELSSADSYINYLQNSDDLLAFDALIDFQSLTDQDQEQFLNALQPENFEKVLSSAFNSIDEEIAVRINGFDVPVMMSSEEGSNFTRALRTDSYTFNLYLWGIKVSSYGTTMAYQYDSKGLYATAVTDVYQNHHNINPGVWTTSDGCKDNLEGPFAYGRCSWTLSGTSSLGFLKETLHVALRGSGFIREHKVESSRSDWGHDWSSY